MKRKAPWEELVRSNDEHPCRVVELTSTHVKGGGGGWCNLLEKHRKRIQGINVNYPVQQHPVKPPSVWREGGPYAEALCYLKASEKGGGDTAMVDRYLDVVAKLFHEHKDKHQKIEGLTVMVTIANGNGQSTQLLNIFETCFAMCVNSKACVAKPASLETYLFIVRLWTTVPKHILEKHLEKLLEWLPEALLDTSSYTVAVMIEAVMTQGSLSRPMPAFLSQVLHWHDFSFTRHREHLATLPKAAPSDGYVPSAAPPADVAHETCGVPFVVCSILTACFS